MFTSNPAYIGRLYFYSLTLAIRPALPSPHAARLAARCPPQGRRERGRSRAQPGNAATKGGREAESFHMPDQWPSRRANRPETGTKGGRRRPRLPLSLGLCGWDNGGARGASQGPGPFSLGGAGPGEPPPASLPPCSLSWGLQVSGLGVPRSLPGTRVG